MDLELFKNVNFKKLFENVNFKRKKKGCLVVYIGDVLGFEVMVEGGFVGIMVDIFINGIVCKEFVEVSIWWMLK